MRNRIFTAVIAVLFTVAIGGATSAVVPLHGQGTKKKTTKPVKPVKRYSCPMHPEVTATRAKRCPKCGMTLRLVTEAPLAAVERDVPPVPPPDDPTRASSVSYTIPNVQVLDQNGKSLHFYDDLVKGKTVAINFIFTTCTGVCPPMTATFRRVQRDLPKTDTPVQLISVSVDPTVDTPQRLHDFASKFQAGPGWTFVTGEKSQIDQLLQSLGTAVANKNDHTPMILIGNEKAKYWNRAYGLSSPILLINLITEAANLK